MAEPFIDQEIVDKIRKKFKKKGRERIDQLIDDLTELEPFLDPLIKWRKGGLTSWIAEKIDGKVIKWAIKKLIELLYKLKELI